VLLFAVVLLLSLLCYFCLPVPCVVLCATVGCRRPVIVFAVTVSEQLLILIHLGSLFRMLAMTILLVLWAPFWMVALNKFVSLDVV
jgi:hypothetical protein